MVAANWEKMSDGGKKVNKNTYDISSIKRVARRFLVTVVQNNGKEMYKKSVLHCKVAFLLIRHIRAIYKRKNKTRLT